jgi:hypothetical protein
MFEADDCNTCFETKRGAYPMRTGDPGDPGLGENTPLEPLVVADSSVPNKMTSIDAMRMDTSEKNPNANTKVSFFIFILLIFYVYF